PLLALHRFSYDRRLTAQAHENRVPFPFDRILPVIVTDDHERDHRDEDKRQHEARLEARGKRPPSHKSDRKNDESNDQPTQEVEQKVPQETVDVPPDIERFEAERDADVLRRLVPQKEGFIFFPVKYLMNPCAAGTD